jgi:hypothetical protein
MSAPKTTHVGPQAWLVALSAIRCYLRNDLEALAVLLEPYHAEARDPMEVVGALLDVTRNFSSTYEDEDPQKQDEAFGEWIDSAIGLCREMLSRGASDSANPAYLTPENVGRSRHYKLGEGEL